MIDAEIAGLLAGARSVRVPFERGHDWGWRNFDWALEYAADLAGLKGREPRARRAVRVAADAVTTVDPAACPYAGQYDEARKWAAVDALLEQYRESRRSSEVADHGGRLMPDDIDLDLGHDHYLRWVVQGPDGPRVGAEIFHRPPPGKRGGYGDGSLCLSIPLWDARSGYPVERLWALRGAADESLTISPSVLCDVCGDHGWVENGKWKVA